VASFTVAANELAVHAKTLTAATVDTVTFSADLDQVEVVNEDGAAAIYFTVDGSTPQVAGNNTYYLPAAIGGLQVTVPTSGNTVVKVISAGTPKYGVSAA